MNNVARSSSLRTLLFAVVAGLTCLVNWVAEGMLSNNGDYWRVSRLFHLTFPTGEITATSWTYDYGRTHHAATLFAVVGRLYSEVLSPLHLHSFNMLWLYLPMCATFFVGVYLAAGRLRTRSDLVVAGLFILVFAAYGFILKSFYEELLLLVLSPWMYWSIRHFHRNGSIIPVAVVGTLVVATKQQSMALIPAILVLTFFQSRRSRSTAVKVGIVVAGLLFSALTLNIRIGVFQYTDANRYDRLMNGVGAAMGGIAFQPGSNSEQWRSSMTDKDGMAEPQVTGRDSCNAIPSDVRQYLGSANWPLGVAIQESDPIEYAKIIHAGRWGSFFKVLATCPVPSVKLLTNMTVGTVRADYRMEYVRTQQSKDFYVQPFLWIRNGGLKFWGALTGLLALVTLARVRTWRQRLVGAFCFLMLPFGVIAGDGFYEFEKHTIVFIGFFPLIYLFFQLLRHDGTKS